MAPSGNTISVEFSGQVCVLQLAASTTAIDIEATVAMNKRNWLEVDIFEVGSVVEDRGGEKHKRKKRLKKPIWIIF